MSRDQFRNFIGRRRDWDVLVKRRSIVPIFVGEMIYFVEDHRGLGKPSIRKLLEIKE